MYWNSKPIFNRKHHFKKTSKPRVRKYVLRLEPHIKTENTTRIENEIKLLYKIYNLNNGLYHAYLKVSQLFYAVIRSKNNNIEMD